MPVRRDQVVNLMIGHSRGVPAHRLTPRGQSMPVGAWPNQAIILFHTP